MGLYFQIIGNFIPFIRGGGIAFFYKFKKNKKPINPYKW